MIPLTHLSGKNVALFGLGGSGIATAKALMAGGANVIAWDDQADKIKAAQAQGIPIDDLHMIDWSTLSCFVLAPGVPLTHPQPHWSVGLATISNTPVLGDIELFCLERAHTAPNSPFVAITGTNGKSTTTALISHILREAGCDVQMGGNIGTAILSLEPASMKKVHVVECSSFQIDLAPSLNPSVGVQLNLSPDHLDRHGSLENYAQIKERLLQGATLAVVGVDDAHSEAMATRAQERGQRLVRISDHQILDEGIYAQGTILYRAQNGARSQLIDLKSIRSLRGQHNAQNACAAWAACSALAITDDDIAKGMASFGGLAHRMEDLRQIGLVSFINDSKGTNADSTQKALASFKHTFWIVGGKAKEGGIAALEPYFSNVTRAYLIGESSDAFAKTLEGKVPYTKCGTMDKAVIKAAADALASGHKDAVVLLSPACASYDQYPNFEVRGDHFRTLVQGLPSAF
jgi:UDP-N-acetylmuramoylalanine--D-glutamate ligase